MDIRRVVAAVVCATCVASGCVEYSWVEIDRPVVAAQPQSTADATPHECGRGDARTGVLFSVVALAPGVAGAVVKDAHAAHEADDRGDDPVADEPATDAN